MNKFSSVLIITLQIQQQQQTHKKRQPVVISKSFYVQILSLCKVDYLRFAALMWTHVDHNFWIRRLQLLSGNVQLATSSTGFLSEILQRVSHLGSDLL